jgi:crotonobetainyl-CoA:carnitine CoA-transferase CaiB-like acyl-CoA transferase
MRQPQGRDVLHELLEVSDVFVINTRPSTLKRWVLDFDSIRARHPKLVMLHVTGFGGGGPASDRPGFGTLAEAMSGFAHITGQAGGPPTLPPFMLADGVAALAATSAVMMALYHRDTHSGAGQLVDVSLIEPLARLVEQATLAYDQLGVVQSRTGNRADASAPRNAYRTSDGRWLAISSASSSIAARVYRAIDRPDLAQRPEYVDPVPRQARADEIDVLVAAWIEHRTLDEAMKMFHAEGVAAAPVYDAEQLLADEHLRARGTWVAVDDPDLGTMTVQAPVAQLSETPGRISHLGRTLGADNDAVYAHLLGLDPDRLAALRAAGTI